MSRNNNQLENIAAEQMILGKVLQSESSFWSVADVLQAQHFVRPIHQQVYQAIRDIFTEGKRMSLALIESRIGPEYDDDGKSTSSLLTALLRDAENNESALDQVEVVVDLWRHRKLIATLEQGLKEAKKPGTISTDLLADLEIRVKDISVNSQAEPLKSLGEIAKKTMSMSSKAKSSGIIPGFDTGLPSLDEILGRIHGGDLGFIGARPGDGKGQALDAQVLTPFGYRRMGDLGVGDLVSSPDGGSSAVIGIYPLGDRQLYKVSFHDGSSTEVTEDHVWLAWLKGRGRWQDGSQIGGEAGAKLFTTAGMIEIMNLRPGAKFKIPICAPIRFSWTGRLQNLPISPYTLGALLGDGSFRSNRVSFTCADPEIVARIESEIGCRLLKQGHSNSGKASTYLLPVGAGVRDALSKLKLMGLKSEGKFIPMRYLKAPVEMRFELLRGLMDTDGWVNVHGDPRIHTKSRRLADDIAWLARSLGAVVTSREKPTYYTKDGQRIDCGTGFELRLKFADGAEAFHLARKKDKCNEPQSLARTIVSIEPTRIAPAQCIKVSHPTSLYLTNDFIVTHNTVLGAQLAERAAQYGPVLYFQLEMKDEDMARRALAAQTNVSVADIEAGAYDFDAMEELRAATERLQSSKVYIDDRPQLAVEQMRDRAIQMKRSKGLLAIVVDHIRLVRTFQKTRDRFDRVEVVTGSLKWLAKDTDAAVIALSQVTRASQRRDDPPPQLNDFDGGSSIEQDADWALALFRRDRWLKSQKPQNMDTSEGKEWAEEMTKHKGRIEVYCRKRRRGEDGEMRDFWFEGRRGILKEIER